MKKLIMTLIAMLCITASTNAMSYEQARREAYFLTDKMAYELNLTPDQYDAAYEINLDYLMGVATVDDVYSDYWRRRNLDMSYILLQWQWDAFCAATYFYRPLYWSDGFWHFAIYARYPRRNYFYFSRPTIIYHTGEDTAGEATADEVITTLTATTTTIRLIAAECATAGTGVTSGASVPEATVRPASQ